VRQLPIGLDIGSATIRMLQLSGTERDLRVVEAGKAVIPLEAKDDPARRRTVVVDSIRRMLKERRFRGREAVICVPTADLAIRNVRMPKMPDADLAEAVGWEAQNKFPFDTATAVVQFLKAGEVRQGDQVLDEIILFAVPRADVESRIQLAADAGLDPVSLDGEPEAVFRGFERFLRRREDEPVVSAFANIGMQTTVVITLGRNIVFVKTIPIGGAVFNRAVVECLELSAGEAEALRRRLARRRENPAEAESDEPDRISRAVHDALRPHVTDLANEIGLCLRYYNVTFRGEKPESIIFSGGEAQDPAIPAELGARLELDAKIGDPFRNVRTDSIGTVVDRRGLRSEWATAFGLSLKGFHLAAQFAAGFAA